MTQEQRLDILLEALLRERPDRQDIPRPAGPQEKRRLLRALMNVRPPWPLDPAFLEVQDAFLAAEREAKGVVEGDALPAAPADPRLALWQGDITRLRADAIVNAANSQLLGCFVPCHGCIDNAIHSAAGLQLREACRRLMEAQGGCEPCGRAKLTPGYNLPASYVLHTVGPIVQGRVTGRDRAALAACYRSCLESASNLRSDSTFVQDEGWYAAAGRYQDFLRRHKGKRVLFLELGVGGNTPAIIKYPFWQMTLQNRRATYACINQNEAYAPPQIAARSICIPADIGDALAACREASGCV